MKELAKKMLPKLTVKGRAVKIPAGQWMCRGCGKLFTTPKLPGSCEEYLSLCVTCGMREINRKLAKEILEKA